MKNNKGMSLVEVVVSIMILSIVSVSIMNLMISSARYNGRARERQYMTQAAESIMESFKAYDVETLCDQFQHNTFPGGVPAAGGSIAVTGTDATGMDTSVLFDPSGNFIGSYDDTYRFQILSLEKETERYDARITLTPYTLSGSNRVTELPNMNKYKDAVLLSQESFRSTADVQIENHFQSTVKSLIKDKLNTEDKIKDDYTEADIVSTYNKVVKRETVISIDKATNTTASIKITYYYKVEGYPYHDDALDPTSMGTLDFPEDGSLYSIQVMLVSPSTYEIEFYNNPSAAGLERVFVYYYPDYKVANDVITFQTSGFGASETVECFLLKQKSTMITNQDVEEAGYTPTVSGTSDINLLHNFNENIGGGATVPTVSPSGFASCRSYTDASVVTKEKTLMYEINVELYEEGGTEVITSLRGTINE